MWTLACLAALLAAARANIIVYTQNLPHSIEQEYRDMPSSFGPELPLEGLRGFLVIGQPENGCSALAKPPGDDNFTGHWIVLLARYNCSFEEKVRNAQLAGYQCAIVHNVDSDDLETMSAKDPVDILIPSVFVSASDGKELAEFNYTSGFYIMVNGDLPFNINTHLLLPFAIVVVLCLLVILIFMIVKCIKDRRRARRHRLPNRCLKKIPTCKFSKGDPYDTCAICLDDYVEGDRLRVLPCAHAYHAKCIDPWLTQNRRVCPVCKRRVLAAGERRARHDSDSDDTEPLLSEPPQTQGGTFDEQSENPFRRAERFVQRMRQARLLRRQQRNNPEAQPATEDDQTNNDNDNDNRETSDTAPLVNNTVTSQTERPRRTRRQRRGRSHSAGTNAGANVGPNIGANAATNVGTDVAADGADVDVASEPTLVHSDEHSINTDAQEPYIGVAALPVVPTTNPHHVNL